MSAGVLLPFTVPAALLALCLPLGPTATLIATPTATATSNLGSTATPTATATLNVGSTAARSPADTRTPTAQHAEVES